MTKRIIFYNCECHCQKTLTAIIWIWNNYKFYDCWEQIYYISTVLSRENAARALTHAVTEEESFMNEQLALKPTARPPIVVLAQSGRRLPNSF